MSDKKERKLGKGDLAQFFNKLEIHRDDVTLTIQFDDTINENISTANGPDMYVKFEDHFTGKSFDQKLYLLEFMLMLRQYIMQVKEFECCTGCTYMRLKPSTITIADGSIQDYPKWPHCSVHNMEPIPFKDYDEFKIPSWCPVPETKDRINEYMAAGLPVEDGSDPFKKGEGEDDGCSGCGSCGGSCGSNGGNTIH